MIITPCRQLLNRTSHLVRGAKAFFPLEDGGGIVREEIGRVTNTPTAVTWTKGKRGIWAYFNGSTSKIQTAFTPASITAYTMLFRFSIAAQQNVGFLVSSRTSDAANGLFFLYEQYSGGIESGFTNAGSLTRVKYGTTLSTGVEYHIAVTHQPSSSSLTMYFNGTAVGSMSETAATNPGNGGPLYFGIDGTAVTPYPFNGNIRDFMFFDRVLTASEVKSLYVNPDAVWQSTTRRLTKVPLFNPAWAMQANRPVL